LSPEETAEKRLKLISSMVEIVNKQRVNPVLKKRIDPIDHPHRTQTSSKQVRLVAFAATVHRLYTSPLSKLPWHELLRYYVSNLLVEVVNDIPELGTTVQALNKDIEGEIDRRLARVKRKSYTNLEEVKNYVRDENRKRRSTQQD
jgi:molybdopterin converting factor small subunit